MGSERVFMDVEGILPGQNFAQTIDHTMETCQDVLVIIGPKWRQILEQREKTGDEDYVRHEIESALARKLKVIPVLVGGATADQIAELAGGLLDLPFHQAVTLHDESFREDCDRLAGSLGGGRKKLLQKRVLLAAGCLVAAMLVPVSVKLGWVPGYGQTQQEKALLATAETQTKLGEYEAAYRSCSGAVAAARWKKIAQERQLDAAMRWLEHYSVLTTDDEKASDVAAPQLTELMGVLDAGLSRAGGKDARSADILAHIGWAHWLNGHIAEKEFGKAPLQAYQQALQIAPTNVYANSMLGNWLLQTHGDLNEAVKHFRTAIDSGQERQLVRTMQLGGMLYDDDPGAPQEAVRALNEMRKNHEIPEEGYKPRFLATLFDPNFSREFLESVERAVPPPEFWLTYLWLDDAAGPIGAYRQAKRDYFQLRVLVLEGKAEEAKRGFAMLASRLRAERVSGRLVEHVAEELATKK